MSSKELKTSIVLSQNGTIDYTKFMLSVDKWAKKALPAKWVVKIYQDLTREQRAYFNGVIVPHVINVISEKQGLVVKFDDAKEYLKENFSPRHTKEGLDMMGNKAKILVVPSSEELTKDEYSELIDKCLNYCIDGLGAPCPESRG